MTLLLIMHPAAWSSSLCDWYLSIVDQSAERSRPPLVQLAPEKLPNAYSRGEKEIDDLIKLAAQLRNKSADYKTTHIQEFSDMVSTHLQFAKEAIESQISNDHAERLALLSAFKSEAQNKQVTHKVSYRWWVYFNFRISILLTPKEKRTATRGGFSNLFVQELYETDAWKSESAFDAFIEKFIFNRNSSRPGIIMEDYIKEFPVKIIFPTLVGEIGISVLNKIFSTGVYPFGQISAPSMIDGREMYPDHFFGHEFVHMDNYEYAMLNYTPSNAEAIHQFHLKFLKIIETLSVKDRQMVEAVYFLPTHERLDFAHGLILGDAHQLTDFFFKTNLEYIVDLFMDEGWFASLLPAWVRSTSREDVRAFLVQSAKKFNEIALKINTGP